MITYEKLSQLPSAFRSLTGMSVEAFDRLSEAFAEAHLSGRDPNRTLNGQPRKRAPGGGRRPDHSLRDRLLMALVWLRTYPTYEVLGFFFSLHKTNARHNVEAALDVLLSVTAFEFERPPKERKKLTSVQAVMDAFPEVALVIDTKEQRIRRPSGRDGEGNSRQKPYYSGKKRAHTLKSQTAVRPDGLVAAVSESVPGSTHDLTLLRKTKLLDRLEDGDGAMMDKAYDGVQKDHPGMPLYVPYKARRNRPLTELEERYNRELSSYRIVAEHTNAQLQKFQALAQVYRHDREKHTRTVRVVAGLVNRQIERQPLKAYLPI
jgi:hypothetical protein